MYSIYDTPNEFFNISTMPAAPGTPVDTTSGFAVVGTTIAFGCSDGAAGTKLLTNLTSSQAGTSTAQLFFGVIDAFNRRFNDIKAADPDNAPTKFSIGRTGYTDEATGEIVYSYSISIRVTPGSLVAVNA